MGIGTKQGAAQFNTKRLGMLLAWIASLLAMLSRRKSMISPTVTSGRWGSQSVSFVHCFKKSVAESLAFPAIQLHLLLSVLPCSVDSPTFLLSSLVDSLVILELFHQQRELINLQGVLLSR